MTNGAAPAGLSEWEAGLLDHLSAHMEQEGALLAEYRTLSEHADAEFVTYLVGMILEDELRHHRVYSELVDTLRNRVEWGDRPGVPGVSDAANPVKLLVATEQLLEREEQDARELERFRRELRDLRGASVWPVLMDVMARDTEKHRGILRFVQQQLDEQVKRARTSWA